MFRMFHSDVERDLQPQVMNTIEKKYKGNFDAWAAALFKSSILTDQARMNAFLAKPIVEGLGQGPRLPDLGKSCLNHYRNFLGSGLVRRQAEVWSVVTG